MDERWTVGEVAHLARVTVRTLRHYDEIGLLVPSGRSASGYRLYALRARRDLLEDKIRETEALVRAVDRTLEAMETGEQMSTEEMFEGFEPLDGAPEDVRAHHARHAREAQERWGETDAYQQSMRSVRRYTKTDWARIKAEAAASEARMAELMASGADPEAGEAIVVAEGMRQHIERWFYLCAPEMHAGLADMYEADARFRAHYDDRAPGLAAFVARAIRANAAKPGT